MSQPDSSSVEPRGVLVRKKPMFDVYTWMLILGFVALGIGTLFLYLEWRRYANRPEAARRAASAVAQHATIDCVSPAKLLGSQRGT